MAATAPTAAFDAQARTSDRRNGPCRVSAPQRTAPGDGKGRGVGSKVHYTAKFWKHPPPRSPARSTSFSTTTACRSSGARGLTVSSTSGRRGESRGALWSRSPTLCPVVPLLHVPVPQPVDSVVDVLKIIDRGPPELVVDVAHGPLFRTWSRSAPLFASRSWRNSWWMCRRPLATLLQS